MVGKCSVMKQKLTIDLWSLLEPMVRGKYGCRPGTDRPPVDLNDSILCTCVELVFCYRILFYYSTWKNG